MGDEQRTKKQSRTNNHEKVSSIENIGRPACNNQVVADIAQYDSIDLVAQSAGQQQTSRRGIEPAPAITVQYKHPTKNHTQDDKPGNGQNALEEGRAMPFQAVHPTVIPSLGAA